jgi:hypothetical protein
VPHFTRSRLEGVSGKQPTLEKNGMDEEGESQIPLPFNFEEAEVDHLVILIG